MQPRRFPVWFYIISLLTILLLAASPLISVMIAGWIAETNGCTLHEGFVNPCVVNGTDIGQDLYAAFVLGWHAPRYARLRRRVLRESEPLLWGDKPW